MRQTLEKVKPSNSNIIKEERLAINALQIDTSIIILPSDKGNTSMVMDKLEYSEKLASLVVNGSYSKVKKKLTLKTERKLS